MLEVASFLDPRFKDQYLQNKDDIITKIILECTENYGSIHEESKKIAESDKLSGEPELQTVQILLDPLLQNALKA